MSVLRVAVLASGEGSNLQVLLDTVHREDGIEIVAVASDRAAARALERAAGAGVATRVFARDAYDDRPARDAAIGDWLDESAVDLVVLAGYMALLDGAFIRRFAGRIVNVHPSLLPAFTGLHAVEQAIAYGVKVFGVTVHFVDEGVDTGPVILQGCLEIENAADAAAVLEQLRPIEHRLLPEAVRLVARGAVTIEPSGRRVHVDRG